uniref:Uncharacterized protein n=2 Tax=Haloterrigena alkaliphila TaxID=2816475 RepID=A0A8A2VED9_9EURY
MQTVRDAHVSNEYSTPLEFLSPVTRSLVADAIDDGDATRRGYYAPDVHTEFVSTTPKRTYYRVTTGAHDRASTTGYEYALEFGNGMRGPTDDDTVYRFDALPAHDRESLLGVIGIGHRVRDGHGTTLSVVFAYEREREREQSVFVPETDVQYVRWEGIPLRITFDGERSVSVADHTVTAERVADSTTAFAERLFETRGVVLDDLTAAQRDIVSQARNGMYEACKPHSDGFADLLDRLTLAGGEFASFARYEGDWYFAAVRR